MGSFIFVCECEQVSYQCVHSLITQNLVSLKGDEYHCHCCNFAKLCVETEHCGGVQRLKYSKHVSPRDSIVQHC